MMIDEIKEIVKNINIGKEEISNNESILLENYMDRLNKIVQVAIKGLEFENIYRKQITYSNWQLYTERNSVLFSNITEFFIYIDFTKK